MNPSLKNQVRRLAIRALLPVALIAGLLPLATGCHRTAVATLPSADEGELVTHATKRVYLVTDLLEYLFEISASSFETVRIDGQRGADYDQRSTVFGRFNGLLDR